MNQRDELAATLKLSGLLTPGESYGLADFLIASGYRKPRTITTLKEMDALPNGSVVLDCDGLSLHKHNSLGRWDASNGARNLGQHELERDAFPTTVLWEPQS